MSTHIVWFDVDMFCGVERETGKWAEGERGRNVGSPVRVQPGQQIVDILLTMFK
jgi:hypothetical protein